MEVNLQIPGIANYNEDVLLLVIPTMTYSKMVLVMVGSKIKDRALSLMTQGELAKVTTTWRQAHFGAVISGSLQLSHMSLNKSQSGRATLEHWSLLTIAPKTQLWGSAPTISCMEDSPTFQ